MKNEINIVDLFCGCGGNASGMDRAIRKAGLTYRGLAINHWKVAVDTMRANFPLMTTLDCKIEEAVPGDLVKGTVHILWASPSCTHHSRACGGRPRSNQLRSQPEYVITWLTQCDVRTLIVENVPEFTEWGPLDTENRPIKDRKGETFRAWIKMIESLGYQVEWRILNCADYGDATTRRRFFLMATRVGTPKPEFPEPTHGDRVKGRKQWRSSRECLDLSNKGRSIFGRKRPLSEKTLARLADGARKYWGLEITGDMLVRLSDPNRRLEPFLVKLRNNEKHDPTDRPISTITSGGRHHMLVQLICDHQNHGKAEPPDRPMKTVSTHDHFSLATLVLGQHGGSVCRPADEPLPTVCTVARIRAIEPIVVDNANGGTIRGAGEPINTITLKDQHMMALPVLEDGRRFDILVRMLEPRELARAHSLPDDFVLTGNKTEQTKQVGNSVPAETAAALCRKMLEYCMKGK